MKVILSNQVLLILVISNAILGIAGGQILLKKFHISWRLHNRFIEICKQIPLRGFAGSPSPQKTPPLPLQDYARNSTLQKTLPSPLQDHVIRNPPLRKTFILIPPQGYEENFPMKDTNTDTSIPLNDYSGRSLQRYRVKL